MAGVNISFTSSNSTVGTVSPANAITGPDGNASVTFTALQAGSAMVNATNGSVVGSAGVTVTAATIVIELPKATINITSPMGGVTLTIQNGTNATDVNGTPLANISVTSNRTLIPNGSAALALIGYGAVGEIVNLGPDGARFDPPIQIRFNYSEPLPGGITESSLEVRFFNASANTWEALPVIERNTTANYIVANVTHFSTFALIGKVPAAAVSVGGGGGGAGTGGPGVVSSEPLDNVAKSETVTRNIVAGSPVTYAFVAPEHGIYEIVPTGKVSQNDIALRVEALKGTSKLVTAHRMERSIRT
jgi:hypothetical protein